MPVLFQRLAWQKVLKELHFRAARVGRNAQDRPARKIPLEAQRSPERVGLPISFGIRVGIAKRSVRKGLGPHHEAPRILIQEAPESWKS